MLHFAEVDTADHRHHRQVNCILRSVVMMMMRMTTMTMINCNSNNNPNNTWKAQTSAKADSIRIRNPGIWSPSPEVADDFQNVMELPRPKIRLWYNFNEHPMRFPKI